MTAREMSTAPGAPAVAAAVAAAAAAVLAVVLCCSFCCAAASIFFFSFRLILFRENGITRLENVVGTTQ